LKERKVNQMAKRNKYENKGEGIDTSKSNINWLITI
jgi:hypothetical protein